MHWVWRAEHGGFKLEYAALVLLVASVAAAVLAFGLPSDVQRLHVLAICKIDPNDEDCEDIQGDGQESADGSEDDEDGQGQEDEEESEAGGEEPGPEGDEDEPEEGEEESEEDDGPEILYDPDFVSDVQDLQDAEDELEQAESDYADLDQELMDLLKDLIGLEDAEKCLTEGDIAACIWSVVGFTPWGKGAKVIKKIPKIVKLFDRWRTLKRTRDRARTSRNNKRDEAEESSGSCPLPSNNVAPEPASAAVYPGGVDGISTSNSVSFVVSSGTQANIAPAQGGGNNKRDCTKLTKDQLTDLATALGYKKTSKKGKWGNVWENKKGKPKYISFDKDQHNGEFKGAAKPETLEKGGRDGSYKVVVEDGTPKLEWVKP